MPRQIPFIIANEGCERFSFYWMRNILTPFLRASLLAYLPAAERATAATEVFHTFVMGVYFFPLLGGWLADRYFGKYRTILWFSLVYCAGQGCLAMFYDSRVGFYAGLGLIALGSGGIKPLVASFMGDQFDGRTKHLAKLVFDAFYWIINLGSFAASLTMPWFIAELGPRIAFGIPGALMFVSTVIFYLGHRRYVMMPPAPADPHSFLRVVRSALMLHAPGESRAVGAAGQRGAQEHGGDGGDRPDRAEHDRVLHVLLRRVRVRRRAGVRPVRPALSHRGLLPLIAACRMVRA